MDFDEIKNLPVKELIQMLADKREELRGLMFQSGERQLKNVRAIRSAKKVISQIMTLLAQKKAE